MHDYTGAFGDSCIFEFAVEHFSAARPGQTAAWAPVRVFLQKGAENLYFRGRFTGIQKSPPQSASLLLMSVFMMPYTGGDITKKDVQMLAKQQHVGVYPMHFRNNWFKKPQSQYRQFGLSRAVRRFILVH